MLEVEKFSIENQKLTGPYKLARHQCKLFYEGQLQLILEKLTSPDNVNNDVLSLIQHISGTKIASGDQTLRIN